MLYSIERLCKELDLNFNIAFKLSNHPECRYEFTVEDNHPENLKGNYPIIYAETWSIAVIKGEQLIRKLYD